MWLLPVLLGSSVVEGRKFTREPTDTTTTVGDKAVLRFGMKLFFWENWDNPENQVWGGLSRLQPDAVDQGWIWFGTRSEIAGVSKLFHDTRWGGHFKWGNFWILSYSIWPPKLYSIFGHSSCLLLTSYNMKWFHAANLIISPVSIADDALYRCQVISEDQKICLHPQGLVMIYLTGAKWRVWSTSHLKASTSERPRPPLRPCHLRWGISVSWPGLPLKNMAKVSWVWPWWDR